jgi:shikimate 5-dehydrogenase
MSFVDLDGLDLSRYEVLVNATPLGRARQGPLPFDLDRVREEALVIDLNYSHQRATALVDAALERDLVVIDGREILLGQGVPQFRMMTGLDMPMTAARRLLS